MERIHGLFLQAMGAALADEPVAWDETVTAEDWHRVMELALEHHVLPMIFETAYGCPAASKLPDGIFQQYRRLVVHSVMSQAVKTEEFLRLYRHLQERGVSPLVVKGIVCRSLYPRPDHRYSGDEDVFCGEERFRDCHKAMVQFGMEPMGSSLEGYEVPYCNPQGGLYIELHKTLFAADSRVFARGNRLFEKAFDHPAQIEVDGVSVSTLEWSEHLLYLILHAFKHFLHSGFGIRQVSDMTLFANAYGSRIDWLWVLEQCRLWRAEKFAAALFAIGKTYLGFSSEQARYPRCWEEIKVDPEPLLEDLLCGGIYGGSDRSRVHSSNMTLNAVEADKKGKKSSLLRTVFPPAQVLRGRFGWLRRHPWLLPGAWLCRIWGYLRETISRPAGSAAEVVRTGNKRVELLRQYDIID